MRTISSLLALAMVLTCVPARAQQGQASSGTDALMAAEPVSLDRIRQALERAPGESLKGLNQQPTFKVEIQEKQKFKDLLSTLDFKSGPVPPGGLYGFESRRLWTPKGEQPYAQPYGAFSQKELLVVALENVLEKYLLGQVIPAAADAEQARARQAAREQVDRELAGFLVDHSQNAAAAER